MENMKIGYTVNESSCILLTEVCDEVVYIKELKNRSTEFIDFVKVNSLNEIYVQSISDLGLQLVQIIPGMTLLVQHDKVIHFLDKGILKDLSDKEYCEHLLYLAENEKEVIVKRTISGIQERTKNGTKSGRPQISSKKIEKIQYLHHIELRSLREIAGICRVSLGTVHKYCKVTEDNLYTT